MTNLAPALGLPFMKNLAASAVDPGLALLQSATFWIDAAQEPQDRTAQWALNRGSGAVPHARLGTTGQTELRGSYGMLLPGAANNGTATGDYAASRPTGNLEIVARISASDWTPGASSTIVVSGTPAAATQNYRLSLNTTGALLFERYVSGGGTSSRYAYSTVNPTVSDGAWLWIKATCTVDNGTGGTDFYFYTAADSNGEPSSWTQLGAKVTTSTDGTGIGNSNTSGLFVGRQSNGANPWSGAIKRIIVRNDIAGTTVFDADFTAATPFATSFTESSANAATVTINSTSGVDASDPTWCPKPSSDNYLYLPGTANNGAWVADSAALRVTGSIDIQVRVAMDDWTPASRQALVAKRGNSGSNFNYDLCLNAAGTFQFDYGDSSTTIVTATSSAAIPATDGTTYWVRVTRNSATGDVNFYYAADSSSVPVSWTQIGTTQTTAAGSIYAGTPNLTVGGWEYTSWINQLAAGKFYRVRILNGILGTAVLDADFSTNTNQSSFTESSSNAATVTINHATAGKKAVMVTAPCWMFGTDDYMEVPDNDLLDISLADSFSAIIIARVWATPASYHTKLSKSAGGVNAGWAMWNEGTSFVTNVSIADGTIQSYDPASTYSSGIMYLLGLVRDTIGDTITAWLNNTSTASTTDSTTSTLTNTLPMTIGKSSGGTALYSDMEVRAVAIFKGVALTSTQLGYIKDYYGV